MKTALAFDKQKKQYRCDSLPGQYTAALVETNLGEKIVLFRHQGGVLGWWSRVYDVEAPATTQRSDAFSSEPFTIPLEGGRLLVIKPDALKLGQKR